MVHLPPLQALPRYVPPSPAIKMMQEDDISETSSHQNAMSNSAASPSNIHTGASTEALTYLLRYETMVRQQEAEDMATWSHIQPLLEKIQVLGASTDSSNSTENGNDSSDESFPPSSSAYHVMERKISYNVLGRALDVLEASSEVMTTDRQLMMVLQTLTQKGQNGASLTWAEFFQCYKAIVGGMQTLQHLPGASVERSRARDRTLSMLSLFEPPSTKLLTDNHKIGMGYTANVMGMNSTTEFQKSKNSKRSQGTIALVIAACATSLYFIAYGSNFNMKILHLMKEVENSNNNDIIILDSSTSTANARETASLVPIKRKMNNVQHLEVTTTLPAVARSVKEVNVNANSNDLQERLSLPSAHDKEYPPNLERKRQDQVITSLIKDNPLLVKTMKHRMIGSAIAGTVTGIALAPTVFVALRGLAPTVVSTIAVAPGLAIAMSMFMVTTLISLQEAGGIRNFLGQIRKAIKFGKKK